MVQEQLTEPTTPAERVLFEVKKVIVGQEHLLERLMVALLARGHILVEGVPGLAKTLAIRTVAQSIGGDFKRIQFTPDLVPADLVGTRIYNQRTGEFTTSLGPVFTNLLLADEINRAPAKVQSALLEVMQERQVTIGRETHRVPDPFLVLATQNPIETEGTYQLPEAQVDRFMLKVLVGYPSDREELVVVQRMTSEMPQIKSIIDTHELVGLQKEVDQVYVDPELMEYAVRLVGATRRPAEYGLGEIARYISFGASPRASINLILGGRALAFLRGRDYVVPHDVTDLALDVIRHRLVLSYEALADGVSADAILNRILERVPRPTRPLADPFSPAGAVRAQPS
jgi:MoxR-like ATPase